MRKSTLFKVCLCAVFSTLALLTFIIENLFPPIILPGAKLGLSNVFILLTLIVLGWQYAYSALIIKTVLGSIFAGNVSMVIYSLPAGAIALLIEFILLKYTKKTSVVCASVAGALINTVFQNATFCIVTAFSGYFAYLPYLSLIAVPSGILVGLTVYLIVKRLPTSLLQRDF